MKNNIKSVFADRRGFILEGLALYALVAGVFIVIAIPSYMYIKDKAAETQKKQQAATNALKALESSEAQPTAGTQSPEVKSALDIAVENAAKAEEARIKKLEEGSAPGITAELNDGGKDAVASTPVTSSGCAKDDVVCQSKPDFLDAQKELGNNWIYGPINFMETIYEAAKSAFNEITHYISNFFVSPPAKVLINLDSLPTCTPSTSCINFCKYGGDLENCRTTNADCTVSLSTKGTSCLPEPKAVVPKPSGGAPAPTTASNSCFASNQSFQDLLSAYEITVPAYEKAAAAAKLPCSDNFCAVVSENYSNAYQRLRDAFNRVLLGYEEALPKCNPADKLKIESCVAGYETALAGCAPGEASDPCFFAETQNAINKCFPPAPMVTPAPTIAPACTSSLWRVSAAMSACTNATNYISCINSIPDWVAGECR